MDEKNDSASVERSLEKKGSAVAGEHEVSHDYVVSGDDRFQFDASDLDQVQRRLKQRHVQMCVLEFLFSLMNRSLIMGCPQDCRKLVIIASSNKASLIIFFDIDRWHDRDRSFLGFW